MRVCAYVPFYNDGPDMLRRCLKSLQQFDVVYAVDGRFQGHAGRTPLSTDGCREVCSEFANVTLLDVPDQTVSEKTNHTFNRFKDPSDVCLLVDSDMYVDIPDFDEFRKGCEQMSPFDSGTAFAAGDIRHWNRKDRRGAEMRTVVNPASVRMSGSRHTEWDHTDGSMSVPGVHPVPHVRIIHDDRGRAAGTARHNRMWHDALDDAEYNRPMGGSRWTSAWNAFVARPAALGFSTGRPVWHPAWISEWFRSVRERASYFARGGFKNIHWHTD